MPLAEYQRNARPRQRCHTRVVALSWAGDCYNGVGTYVDCNTFGVDATASPGSLFCCTDSACSSCGVYTVAANTCYSSSNFFKGTYAVGYSESESVAKTLTPLQRVQ